MFLIPGFLRVACKIVSLIKVVHLRLLNPCKVIEKRNSDASKTITSKRKNNTP